MVTIKLNSIYPDVEENIEITIPNEVFEAIVEDDRAEGRYWRKVFRHKAHYSLNCGDGIENETLLSQSKSHECYEDRLLLEKLYAALDALPEIQARRIHAHFFKDMSQSQIAKTEGVHRSSVQDSIRRGLEKLKKSLENFK